MYVCMYVCMYVGRVRVELYDLQKTTFISAHETALAAMALNYDGTLLATASEKVCMYVCMYVCECVCVYMCVCVYVCLCIIILSIMYEYLTCDMAITHTYITHTYTYIHTYIHTYTHTYIHTYTHTYIHYSIYRVHLFEYSTLRRVPNYMS